MDGPSFELNGQRVALAGCDPRLSLLRWLAQRPLHGTKEGCGDGDCGACTVALIDADDDGSLRYRAVNSCLLPMGLLVGRRVLTVEALAARNGPLHPVQQALIDTAGSQCGYCTPGFVMSLFVGWQHGELDDATTEGNLCRCTGYRPIREATQRLREQPATTPAGSAVAAMPSPKSASDAPLHGFLQPRSLADALALRRRHPDAAWIAGATDLGVDLSRARARAPMFIALDRLDELQVLEIADAAVTIGAGVSLRRLETALAGMFPALDAMLHGYAARQVKNRATLGGNLGTASPIGDLLPVLLALDAEIECVSADASRWLPIDGFFTGYRQTRLGADELIARIRIPRLPRIDASYKVARRATDDISIVAAAFALQRDADGSVGDVRLAYGGVAATPLRAHAVEAALRGRRLDEATVDETVRRLQAAFTPLSDQRAGADYRRALAGNLFRRFVAERCR